MFLQQQPDANNGDAESKRLQAFTANGQEGHTDIQLTQMRKVIARRLGESKFTAPHFYLTMEINMDNAIVACTCSPTE